VKVTWKVAELPAVMGLPGARALVTAKSPASPPVKVMPEMVRSAEPAALSMLKVRAPPLEPTSTMPKVAADPPSAILASPVVAPSLTLISGASMEKFRMVPEFPTAQPVLASVKCTPLRCDPVPEVWAAQVAPPLEVWTMVPEVPTAQPLLASVKCTPMRSDPVPEVWVAQLAPPLEVVRMVPALPTAQPLLASVKCPP
jgi:hypothetical protein